MFRENLGLMISQVSTSPHQLKSDYTGTQDLTSRRKTQKPQLLRIQSLLTFRCQNKVNSACVRSSAVKPALQVYPGRPVYNEWHILSFCEQMKNCLHAVLGAQGQRSLSPTIASTQKHVSYLPLCNTSSKMALNVNQERKEAGNVTVTFI